MNIILYAIPFFLLLIALELLIEKIKRTQYYSLSDSLTSLSTGSINQLVRVANALIPFTVYVFLFENYALWQLSDSLWVWCVAFVVYDFCYYWNHRMGHEMNVLWASHVVHHSSEEYNLTTALRQTGTGFLSFVFYLPLAILGFDPLMIVSVGALNLVYQFWVHTRHIGKLGWFELFFVTPSNHRGHHAQNTIYIDKNYGGVFIVWDRLFNTYQEECEHDLPVFGIRGAVRSWNPLWVNAQIYHQLLIDALRTNSLWHKCTLWFRRTGWRPPDVAKKFPLEKPDELASFSKYNTFVPLSLKLYCVLQYISLSSVGLFYSVHASTLSIAEQICVVSFVFLSAYGIGGLMDHKRFSRFLEWFRLSLTLLAITVFSLPQVLTAVLLVSILLGVPLMYWGWQSVLQHHANIKI